MWARMAVTAAFLLALCGCGNESGSDTARDSDEQSSEPEIDNYGICEPVKAPGFVMTIKKFGKVNFITVNNTMYESGSGFETWTKRKPRPGGRFVVLDTRIKNTSTESMDITCNWPINLKVFNTESQEFDPVEDLYKLRGNPECNAQLLPLQVEDDVGLHGAQGRQNHRRLVDVGDLGNECRTRRSSHWTPVRRHPDIRLTGCCYFPLLTVSNVVGYGRQ